MHNNGLFYPKKNKNYKYTWREGEYEFKYAEYRNFGFEHCSMLVQDLIELNLEIMKSSLVSNLKII